MKKHNGKKENNVGKPLDEKLLRKTKDLSKALCIAHPLLDSEQVENMMHQFIHIITELRKNKHSMTAIAKSLGISKVYLYSLIHEPHKCSESLIEKLTYLYQNQHLIETPPTQTEKLEKEIATLKQQLSELQEKYDIETKNLQLTINVLSTTLAQLQKQ
ncbi:MAG: hypothetical protein ACTTJH_08280 [Bacteroidales bacterium]